jgi:hypothetical protein
MNTHSKQTEHKASNAGNTVLANRHFLNDFQVQHHYFLNKKVISMFTALENNIEKSKSKMFELNTYSNVAHLKNTELMLKNYLVFVFLLENIQFLKQKELEMYLNILKWQDDNFILEFYDFVFLKTLYFHCSGYDFSDKQTVLFDADH